MGHAGVSAARFWILDFGFWIPNNPKSKIQNPKWPRFCVALLLALLARPVWGEDVVYLSSPRNRQARTRISGEIVDYTGRQLVVRVAEGREIKRPGQQVVSIESEWPPGKAEGDRFFDEHQFQSAREKYVAAVRKETRPWARRMLVARIIACYRESNQFDGAGKLFIALVREDPDTPYFDQIPLIWLPGDTAAAQAQSAEEWLADENPVAGLLGASRLLATTERARSLDRLTRLMLEKDARVASLAEAQEWRATIPTADDAELAKWEQRVETFPVPLRAGPYWVLGRALAQHRHADRAVLALLHVPILYPDARLLAADSLATSAQILEKQGDRAAALRLNEELVSLYPETNRAAEAKASLLAAPPARPPASPSEADGLEQAFLSGLRAWRLFALAEQRCRQRLADTGLGDDDRMHLAIELSRTCTEHALNEAPADRGPLWAEAVAAVKSSADKGSRRLLVEAQAALVHLARGELTRQEAELAGSAAAPLDAARQELRTAIGFLQAVAKNAASEVRRSKPPARAQQGDLDADELASLQRNIDYQLARAFRNQGESYPPKSADRTNSLRQAVEKLGSLTAAEVTDSFAWPARVDEVVCLRLLEDFEAAAARLQKLNELQPPPAIAATLEAEAIRLALDEHRVSEALAAAEKVQQSQGRHRTADVDYACLEAYVAAWRAASKTSNTEEAGQWQDRAADMIRRIDARYGRYWSRRAEMLLAGNVARGGTTQNLGLLVRAAESLYRSGQLDDALAAYDRAARQAAESKDSAAAFDYAYTAAAIEQHREHYHDAAQRFRSMALEQPENAKAGEAHLLAIYNTALAVKQGGEAVGSPAYLDLLNDHLRRWPDSPTANEARMWLGQFYESEGRWQEAVAAFRGASGAKAAAAMEAVSRCYQKRLAALADSGQPTAQLAAEAADDFERVVLGSRNNLPERWSQTERIAATGAASLWLQYTDQYARAERLLSAALADSSDAPDAWKSSAQTLVILAVAAQGRREEAAKLLSEFSGGADDELLVLFEGLDRAAASAPPAVASELAELQLQAAKLLKPRLNERTAAERQRFERTYIRALAAAKRHGEAIEAAKQLAEAHPRDGEIQEEYARLLVESPDRANWETGLSKWRDIGQKTRQGSERWLRSMYYQALTLEHLGRREQAARLIKLAEALVPDLGGAEMKEQFRRLRQGASTRPGR